MVAEQLSHYRILNKLGSGGMGEVFLAQDIKLERKVAIKMLPTKSIEDHRARSRLIREAKAAATLDHPNICAIHEVNEDGDRLFIVMQYIEGETLSCKIERSSMAPEEVLDIGIQVAEALAEAHTHGIIHRDIKPQNVIVSHRGQVKVLDFGLVKVQTERPTDSEVKTETQLTQEGHIVGTVAYMSPEQLKAMNIDGRSDLFSLGVTLYECATGTVAFTGNSKIEISSKVLHIDPPKPSHIKPGIPPGLEDIILKAMAKDVEARYQSAGAMLEDLRRLHASLSIGTEVMPRPLTTPGSPRIKDAVARALKRNPVRIALLALLLIAAILGIWYIRRPAPYQPSAEAKTWYDRGTEAIRASTYYQASKALELSTRIDAKFALAHARLAETYVEMDYTEKAMGELLQAISLVPDRSALTWQDAMYLDGIAATVRRDFASAITYYGKIADQASATEKASTLVDLGRAYEKNENIDKAIECYVAAANADPQSAAAFLRLALMYGRRQDLKNASEAFDKAEALYLAMSNTEGLTEVLFQRGALLTTSRKLAEAKSQLERALEISRTTNNHYQFVKTQLQLGDVYYAEGNTERAEQIAIEAIRLAQANNIRNLATNGLIDLGYTLQSRGEFNEAGTYFKQALDIAQTDRARPLEARAKLALGMLNFQQGNLDEAITFLDEALKFYQPGGYGKQTSLALLTLGRAQRNKGEYEVALKTFEQQLQLSKNLGAPAQLSASHLSVGILLGEYQERYAEALPHLDESYRIDKSIGAKVGMAYDQMYRGIVLWHLGRYDEARSALNYAASIASQPETNYKEVLAWVRLTDSQMALSERRFAEAKVKGQQALDLKGTEVRDLAIQAKYTICLAQALSGAARPARKLCEEAVATAKEAKNPRLISSALLALAEACLLASDAQCALANSLEAQAMFARSGQQDSEWRAWLIAARASQPDKSNMKEYASRADNLCAGLQQKWGKEAYDGYLQRPDIQANRRNVSQLLAGSN